MTNTTSTLLCDSQKESLNTLQYDTQPESQVDTQMDAQLDLGDGGSFDYEAKEMFDTWEKYLDNILYQRDNIEESSDDVGIEWRGSIENSTFRIPNMAYNVHWRKTLLLAF